MAFRTFSEPILVSPAREGQKSSSYVAEEEVKQGQLVKAGTADQSVEPSDTDGERVVGFALYDAVAGDYVDVVEADANVRATSGTGSITAGDPIASHGGTGEEGEVATAASGDYVIGRALKDNVGTNDDVEIAFIPEGFVYGGDPA